MKTFLIFIIATGALHTFLLSSADGQTWNTAIGDSLYVEDIIADVKGQGGFGLHFQWGFMMRLADNMQANMQPGTNTDYLITCDLVGLNWSRTESTWGLGLHFAYDENGQRLGVKGLWRTPLKKGTWSYFQLAPGVYVSSTDNRFKPKLPGFFLEAELGVARELAFVVAVEALPYENRYLRRVWVPATQDWAPYPPYSGTATTVYAGAKAGQLGAMILTAIGLIAGIAVAASFNSGGFM